MGDLWNGAVCATETGGDCVIPWGDLKQVFIRFLKHPVETIWLMLIAAYVCLLVKYSTDYG